MNSKYLTYLSFLHLDVAREKQSLCFRAMNSGTPLSFCNRVFVPDSMSVLDGPVLKEYYGALPFTIWISESNVAGCASAEKMGFNLRVSYPMMAVDLRQVSLCILDDNITVKQLTEQEEILAIWVTVAATAFGISLPDFKKFIEYLLSAEEGRRVQFYVAYYRGIPAATAMLILRDGVADMHWVGTLVEYRRKGLGYAISCYPLQKVKAMVDTVVLFASEMGRSVYEKMGFSVVEFCRVYSVFEGG